MTDNWLGYIFKNPALLEEALTHPSATGDARATAHYERLEFLGDSVLSLIVTEYLYTRYPEEKEGALAKRRAALVRGETLAKIATELGVGEHLILGEGEESSNGRENVATLENALEAIIGAIYLDGKLEAARKFISPHFIPYAERMVEPPKDAKTALQEWAQGQGLPLPAYTLVGEEGPAHDPIFTIQVEVQGFSPAKAKGTNKRRAEKEAATALLKQLNI